MEAKRPSLFEFAYFPGMEDRLDELAELAEPEEWEYKNTESDRSKPILFSYIQHTYIRLGEENKDARKIVVSDDKQWATFNTGLVTPNQEPIYGLFDKNQNPDRQPWHFKFWCRKGQYELNVFPQLPEMAHYFDDPSSLVFDTRRELRINVEHIIEHNKERFPDPYKSMANFPLQNILKGAIDSAKERVKRNYKTAIPQYYRGERLEDGGRLQLLLPLCLDDANKADLALAVEISENFYRVSTCLTLDMAYNNARLLARPDRDWLQP